MLGITQGLSELLPISSSGHLILVPWLADWHYLEENPVFNKTFDVALHLGTLVAVVVYFWDDVVRFAAAWFRSVGRRAIRTSRRAARLARRRRDDARGDRRRAGETRSRTTSASRGRSRSSSRSSPSCSGSPTAAPQTPRARRLRPPTAVGVGARAGPRADAGRLALGDHDHRRPVPGLDRDSAARFSFLLLIPISFGAVLYKGVKDVVFGTLPAGRRARSSSARSPPPASAWSRSTSCSATCGATTTRRS